MRQKHSFARSFIVAVNGIIIFFRTERSAQIQLLVSIAVIVAGIYFEISLAEWLLILGCIVSVLVIELLNTAIEKVCNLITEEHHPVIKVIKDMCAGAVLLTSIAAVIIGLIVFLPRLIE